MEKDVEDRVAMEVDTMRQKVQQCGHGNKNHTGGKGMGFLTGSCKKWCSLSVF